MTDIKMSEVFEASEINFGGLFAQSLDDDKKFYAAHEAVRQHDKLAEDNERLREALDNLLAEIALRYGIRLGNIIGAEMREAVELAHKALAKG